MSDLMIVCCANCRWYKEYEEEHPEADVDAECRRFPPQIYGNDFMASSAFPGAIPSEWCGEYTERQVD